MTLKPITVRIPENLNDRLGYAAIDCRTTKQAIVIEALELWFEKKEEEEKMKEDAFNLQNREAHIREMVRALKEDEGSA